MLAEATEFPLTMPYPIMPVGVVAGKLMIDGGWRDAKGRMHKTNPLKTTRFIHKNRVERHESPWRQGSRLWSGLLWAASWCRRSSSSPPAGSSGCRCRSTTCQRQKKNNSARKKPSALPLRFLTYFFMEPFPMPRSGNQRRVTCLLFFYRLKQCVL